MGPGVVPGMVRRRPAPRAERAPPAGPSLVVAARPHGRHDPGPGRHPPAAGDHRPAAHHGIGVVPRPVHPWSLEPGLDHDLVGALHRPAPDWPAFGITPRVVQHRDPGRQVAQGIGPEAAGGGRARRRVGRAASAPAFPAWTPARTPPATSSPPPPPSRAGRCHGRRGGHRLRSAAGPPGQRSIPAQTGRPVPPTPARAIRAPVPAAQRGGESPVPQAGHR